MLPFRLADVSRVEFYKRDEITTDLICCEITAGDLVYFRHEDAPGWPSFVGELENLPGFDRDWHAKVVQPGFAGSRTVAFLRT